MSAPAAPVPAQKYAAHERSTDSGKSTVSRPQPFPWGVLRAMSNADEVDAAPEGADAGGGRDVGARGGGVNVHAASAAPAAGRTRSRSRSRCAAAPAAQAPLQQVVFQVEYSPRSRTAVISTNAASLQFSVHPGHG